MAKQKYYVVFLEMLSSIKQAKIVLKNFHWVGPITKNFAHKIFHNEINFIQKFSRLWYIPLGIHMIIS